MYLLKTGAIKGKLGASLQKFISDCERWRGQLTTLSLGEVTELVLEESGYIQMWQQEKTPEAAGRLENLKELTRAIGEFESINAFLEHVSLVTEAANNDNSNDMISLMTLHAAKGLEFDVVFLPGWEEGVFPHQRAIDESGAKGLEEERRLAYVGITRARKKLYISYAANRRIYNQWQSSVPSRFIGEIPSDNVEQLSGGVVNMARNGLQNWGQEVADILASSGSNSSLRGGNADAAIQKNKTNDRIASASPRNDEESKFKKGQRIFHQKFGYGYILTISGNTLEISFDKAGKKKLLADFVELPPS